MDQLSNLNFVSGAKITGLPQSTAAGEAVTHEQLNAAIEGLKTKAPVVAASTANINLASPGATIDGVTMNPNDRFLAKDQTTQSQNGIYVWNGAATPATRAADANSSSELTNAVVDVLLGTQNGETKWRQVTVNPTVDTTNIVWDSFGSTTAPATTTSLGTTELATQAEVDAGTAGNLAVTAETLNGWAGRLRRFTSNVGDGSQSQFDFTHNFNTFDVMVQVYRNSGARDNVACDVSRTNANTVRLNFAGTVAANAYRVVIWG